MANSLPDISNYFFFHLASHLWTITTAVPSLISSQIFFGEFCTLLIKLL